MVNVLGIYKKYKIIPSVIDHQLRVAAVVALICEKFNEDLDKESVIVAALLHDMGNILKIDLQKYTDNFPIPEEGIDYWQSVKDSFKEKYGSEPDEATYKIVEEIGVSEKIKSLLHDLNFEFIKSIAELGMDKKILKYADLRVAFHNVISLEDRIQDAIIRYPGVVTDELHNVAREIEKQIFEKCSIKPEDINDESVKDYIEKLKNFEI